MLYEDFDLRVQSDGSRFVVSARCGEQTATEPFELDLHRIPSLNELENASDEVERCGFALFGALIRGKVRDLYHQAAGAAGKKPDAGVRLRLHLDPADARLRPVMALPWELLRDSSSEGTALPAIDARRPLVRVIDSIEPALVADDRPLERVLIAMADPVNAAPLELEPERAVIEAVLATRSLRPAVLQHATRKGLQEQIAREAPQLVHFMGHGDFDPAGGGLLVLESASRLEDHLPAHAFTAFFQGREMPRLVVLAACRTGQSSDRLAAPFAGVAISLVKAGLPAVIAMQSEIRNENATRFTQRLYTCLVQGDSLEAAVAEARQALFAGESLDWAAPVLFTRRPAAALLPVEKIKPAEQQPSSPATHIQMPISNHNVQTQFNVGYAGSVHQHGGTDKK